MRAQDFGDLSQARALISGTSNSLRGIFAAGIAPSRVNTIDFITIASTGNAADFGDMTETTHSPHAGSNGHGGLS